MISLILFLQKTKVRTAKKGKENQKTGVKKTKKMKAHKYVKKKIYGSTTNNNEG